MKHYKKIVLPLLSIIVLFFVFITWYEFEFSMEEAETFQVNSPDFGPKLLIATQGSTFKNTITNGIVHYYKQDSVFIKVIDIASLPDIDPEDYNAITVIHTWENWKPPVIVKSFIERTKEYSDKIVVLTTSGEGTYKMENVDAITGESKMKDAPLLVEKIIIKLEPLIGTKDQLSKK